MVARILSGAARAVLPLSLLFAVLAGGCGAERSPDGPLSCDRSVGSYFDPVTSACVVPATPEKAYLLDQYRYLNELVRDVPSPVEFQVNFSRYLSPAEFRALTDTFGSNITFLKLYLPNVQGGTTLAAHFAPSASAENAASGVVSSALASGRFPNDSALVDGVNAALANGEYQIWTLRFLARAEDALNWWNAHKTDVRLVQPRIRDVDRTQTDYCPECSIP